MWLKKFNLIAALMFFGKEKNMKLGKLDGIWRTWFQKCEWRCQKIHENFW